MSILKSTNRFVSAFPYLLSHKKYILLGGGVKPGRPSLGKKKRYVSSETMTEQPTCTNSDYLVAVIAISKHQWI